jgi:hypothetical protein
VMFLPRRNSTTVGRATLRSFATLLILILAMK